MEKGRAGEGERGTEDRGEKRLGQNVRKLGKGGGGIKENKKRGGQGTGEC